MSDGVTSAKLEPVSGGPGLDLLEIAGDVIGKHHESLAGAEVRWFWALDRPLSFWGRAKVLTEESWWLSGLKISDRVDIAVQVNLALWKELTNAGRIGLIDTLLSWVKRKEGGNTEMDTQDGTRKLYEGIKFSLGINPEVMARHPRFVQEVDELKRLQQALSDPAQFLLDLQEAAESEEEEQDEGENGGETTLTPAMGEESEPVHYYKQFEFEAVGRATLRFTEADRRVSSLDGVYIGYEDGSDRAALEYATDHGTILSFRERLDEYLEGKLLDEVKTGAYDPYGSSAEESSQSELRQGLAGLDGPVGDPARDEDEEVGAEVLPMRGRRAGSRA